MIKVLCCCNPTNEIGEAPAGLPFEMREWIDQAGNVGLAYPSHGIDWDNVPGFVSAHAARPTTKTWRNKTWREKTWRKR